jgi:hypothetical protein
LCVWRGTRSDISHNAATTVPDRVTAPLSTLTFQFTIATQAVTAVTNVVIQIADAASGFVLFSDSLDPTL